MLGHLVHVPNCFEHFLEPVFEAAHHALAEVFTRRVPGHAIEWALMARQRGSSASLGIFLARLLLPGAAGDPGAAGAAPRAAVHRLLLNKYYVDELYDALFVRGLALGGGQRAPRRRPLRGGRRRRRGAARAWASTASAWLTRDVVARLSNVWDRYVVDGLVNLTAAVLDNVQLRLPRRCRTASSSTTRWPC